MKLVQLVRPLFITAIGLHAALLFVPIGPDEPVVIEDVELSTLSGEDSAKIAQTTPAGLNALPVPDPNVTSASVRGTGATAAKTPASRSTATARTTNRSRATTTARTATRTARRTTQNSAQNSTQNSASTATSQSNNTSGTPATNRTAATNNAPTSGSTSGSANLTNGHNTASSTGSQTSIEPQPSASTNTNSEASNAVNQPAGHQTDPQGVDIASRLTMDALLAKVTQELPKDFRTFVDDLNQTLTHSAKLTDDQSVADAKADWQATIQSQANVGQIEPMPTAEISELTKISYPIESSIKSAGLSLSRCLDPQPAPAEIGVLFDSRGEISGDPKLIRSTGYSALNDEIKAIVAAYEDFPRDRNSKAYTFEVEVDYDADTCVSLAKLKGDNP